MSCCLNIFRKKMKTASSQSTEVLQDSSTDLSTEAPSVSPSPNSDFLLSKCGHPWSVASNISLESMSVGPTRLPESRLDQIDPGFSQSVVAMDQSPQSSTVGLTSSFNAFGVVSSTTSIEGCASRTKETSIAAVAGVANARFGSLLHSELQQVQLSRLSHGRYTKNAPAIHDLSSNFRRCVRDKMTSSSIPYGSLLNGPTGTSQDKPSSQKREAISGFDMNDFEPRSIEEIVAKPQQFELHVERTNAAVTTPLNGFIQHPW